MTAGYRVSDTTSALLERAGQSLGRVAATCDTGLCPRPPNGCPDHRDSYHAGPARLCKGSIPQGLLSKLPQPPFLHLDKGAENSAYFLAL